MNQQQAKYRRQKHWIELKELGYIGASLAKIRGIERSANKLAEDACNIPMSQSTINRRRERIIERVREVFGGDLPDNFYVNMDPRGYSLKIDQDGSGKPISYQDWGGNGILAPEDL